MFIFVLFCYCYGHNGHNGQALIVSVHIIPQPLALSQSKGRPSYISHQTSAISLHPFRITIKKVLDNYAVKIGRAKRKAPAGKLQARGSFCMFATHHTSAKTTLLYSSLH